MYELKELALYYCVTPVHVGSGTGLGIVDSPIQREIHTSFPMFPGSGIKGSLKDYLSELEPINDKMIETCFGAEDTEEGAGALSFTDASVVFFPIRSLTNGFVYLCCPLSLMKLQRLAKLSGIDLGLDLQLQVNTGEALVSSLKSCNVTSDSKIFVGENYSFEATLEEVLAQLGEWVGKRFQKTCNMGFVEMLRDKIILVSDEDFIYFINNATSIEAHIKIDDNTGTAAENALFYIENLPPESILVGMVFASNERRRDGTRMAGELLDWLNGKAGDQTFQIGGNATIGRGLVSLVLEKGEEVE